MRKKGLRSPFSDSRGKFHQVKRMLATVGKPVTYLKRLRMGELWLDETLELGNIGP